MVMDYLSIFSRVTVLVGFSVLFFWGWLYVKGTISNDPILARGIYTTFWYPGTPYAFSRKTHGAPSFPQNVHSIKSRKIILHCGWKKSYIPLDGWNPDRISHLSTSAGFLPSTVLLDTYFLENQRLSVTPCIMQAAGTPQQHSGTLQAFKHRDHRNINQTSHSNSSNSPAKDAVYPLVNVTSSKYGEIPHAIHGTTSTDFQWPLGHGFKLAKCWSFPEASMAMCHGYIADGNHMIIYGSIQSIYG